VVTGFTDMLLAAIARLIGQNPEFDSWTLIADANGENGIPFGVFLTALVAFLNLAAVVYYAVIVPYQRAKQRFFPSEVEEEGVTEEVALLTQNRDALLAQGNSAGGASSSRRPNACPHGKASRSVVRRDVVPQPLVPGIRPRRPDTLARIALLVLGDLGQDLTEDLRSTP
jgi:large conductance mechanosensitive channel